MNFAKPFELLKLGQGRRRDAGEAIWGILADNPNVPGNSSKCMVRFPAGADENGVQQYYPPIAVRHGIGANFVKKGGRRVWVGMGYDGQPEIKQGDWQDLVQVGITPAKTNALSTEGKVANPANPFAPLLSEPVNTSNTPGMLVTVYPLWYDTGSAIKYYSGTGLTAAKVDLTSFVPAAGEWCYVVLWLDTDMNALETPTASTPAVLTSTFGNADMITALEECYAAKPNTNCIPIKAFYLADAQTTLRQSTRHHDLRQMVNMPGGGGSSLPVVDTTAIVKGSADATKLLRFEVDGFTTATTRVLTPPNYDGTIATLAGTETLTGKTLTSPTINTPTISGGTIDNTPVGTTTRALGYFSALREYIGGFAAIFTHANSADRTYTLPNATGTIALLSDIPAGTMSSFTVSGDSGTPQAISDGNTLNIAGGAGIDSVASATDVLTLAVDATVIRTSGTQSIGTGLTVDTPTIANLTNMQHDHLDADDGGLLPATAIPSVPYKTGLPTLRRLDNATLYISPGVVDVNGTRVEYTTTRVLGMATNADWIGGTSLEAASTFGNVYSDAAGNRLLYDALPNCPTPVAPVFTAQINGSPGLNGTSIVYDGDTGEGNLAVGMLLGVYTNSTFTTGRGRGAAAAGHLNNASFALITAINTGTNTITVEAGHNINLTDNDYLMAVPFGPLIYRDVSSTWYRFLGSMYNNASSNLDDDRLDNRALHVLASSYSTTSTTVVDVDSTNLLFSILSTGTDIIVTFTGTCAFSGGATGGVSFDFFIDGVAYSGGTGVQKVLTQANTGQAFGWIEILKNLLPGTHTILAKFWSGAAGTSYILANSTLAGTVYTTKNQFIVERAN